MTGAVLKHADPNDDYFLLVVSQTPVDELRRWRCLVLMDSLNLETAGDLVDYSEGDLTRYFERVG